MTTQVNQLTARLASDISDAGDISLLIDDLQGTPATYRMTLEELRKYTVPVFDVRDYGATGSGSGDDTPEIQAAIAAAEATLTSSVLGAQVLIPQGRFIVTETLVIKDGIQLVGTSKRGSVLWFIPTANDTCVEMGDGTAQNSHNQIRNIEIRSTTGYNKVGIHVIDCSQAVIENVFIRFSDTSGNYDDVGIKVAGRESLSVRDTTIYAPVPIYFDDTGGEGSDNCCFDNLYLVSDPAPDTLTRACVLIDPTTVASHISFTGRQAWAIGDYGVHYSCNVTSGNLPSLHFSNVRMEQGQLGSGYSFNFDCTQGDMKVILDNCKTAIQCGGIYARNCKVFANGVSIRRNSGSGATAESIDVDSGTLELRSSDILEADAVTIGSSTISSNVATGTSLDDTPSVANTRTWKSGNAGSTTITDFDDGIDGQRITVVAKDNHTTIDHDNAGGSAGPIILAGAADKTLVQGDVIELVNDAGVWREVASTATI